MVTAAILCLWYTWPRSFEELAGNGRITYVSVIAMESGPSFHVWGVDGNDEDGEAMNRVEEILKRFRYRTSLRNLLPFPSAKDSPGEGSIYANVNIDLDDGSFFWMSCRGSTAVLHFDNRTVIQALNGNISQELFDYAREYGYKIENKS